MLLKSGGKVVGKRRKRSISIVGILILILVVVIGNLTFRFDYAGGTHRIIPTAIDNDFWGNYKVYYRTSIMTQNQNEDHYFIARNNTYLAEMMREAIRNNQEVIVTYERYIGFKGFTAPESSPITNIEFLGGN